jgi:hypothetical protein
MSDKIDNINDRKILILLERKGIKSRRDKRKIRMLKMVYPDNERFEDKLTTELLQKDYLAEYFP